MAITIPTVISALPTAPSINDPSTFSTRTDAFIGALSTMVSQTNAAATATNTNATEALSSANAAAASASSASSSATLAAGYLGSISGTSTTSTTVATTGSKTFTTQSGEGYVAGQTVKIARTSDPVNTYMLGYVTSYSGTSLVVSLYDGLGTGTYTDWTIMLNATTNLAVPGPIGNTTPNTSKFSYMALGAATLSSSSAINSDVTYTANSNRYGINQIVSITDEDLTASRNYYGEALTLDSDEDGVETTSYAITNAVWTTGTVTLTTSPHNYYNTGAITSITISGSTGTINISSGHNLRVGMVITIAGSTSNANGDRTITSIGTSTASFTLTGVTAGTGGTYTTKSAFIAISTIVPVEYNAFISCTIVNSTTLTYALAADPGTYISGGIIQVDHGWSRAIYGFYSNVYNGSANDVAAQTDTLMGARFNAIHRSAVLGKSSVGSVYGSYNNGQMSRNGTITGSLVGSYNIGQNTTTGTIPLTSSGGIFGAYNYALNASTGSVGHMYGSYNYALNNSTATLTGNMFGLYSSSVNVGGTVASQYGLYNNVAVNATSGTAVPTTTTAYGVYNKIDKNLASPTYGTLTTGYGTVNFFEGTITNKIGVYNSDATSMDLAVKVGNSIGIGHWDIAGLTGTTRINISSTGVTTINPAATITAGGDTIVGMSFSSTASLGVYFGSGAPTMSAAKGSLYLNTTATTTTTRMYVNTSGSTTWTNLTTAA